VLRDHANLSLSFIQQGHVSWELKVLVCLVERERGCKHVIFSNTSLLVDTRETNSYVSWRTAFTY